MIYRIDQSSILSLFREYERTLHIGQRILKTWISGMRPRPIRIATCRIPPLFPHFHASILSHFGLLPSSPISWHDDVAIQFLPGKRNPVWRGGRPFKLSLRASVKVSLMVM
jgi:hypothetical protein